MSKNLDLETSGRVGGMDAGQGAGLQNETDRLRMASREVAEIAGGGS